jgi:hypothetical protein
MKFVVNWEALEQTQLASGVAARARVVVFSRSRCGNAALQKIVWTIWRLRFFGLLRLMVLIIGRAECQALNRYKCIVDEVPRLKSTPRLTVGGFRKRWQRCAAPTVSQKMLWSRDECWLTLPQ